MSQTARVEPPLTNVPDVPAIRAWLRSSALIGSNGAVRSWLNPAKPGYDYPEAGGLWLSAMLSERAPLHSDPGLAPLARRVGDWVVQQVEGDGAVSRYGRRYTFDAAMVLRGLSDARDAGLVLHGSDEAVARSTDFVLKSVMARRASFPPAFGDDVQRWSENFGPHLLKLALALPAAVLADTQVRQQILAPAFSDLQALERDGRFPVHSGSDQTYLHAHCYAVEGLLRIGPMLSGVAGDASNAARRAATWLASVQRDDGALHAWADSLRTWGPLRADATAQAVRIWATLGGYDVQIGRALSFLATLQAPDGGIRYEPGCDDVNSWVTLFTMQAATFAGVASGAAGPPNEALARAIV